jgi:hypothetical protein
MVIQKSDERFYTFYNKSRKINNIKINNWFARRTKLNKPNQMNTQPTPEDEQIMNDILIQLERMKQNQKNLYLQLIPFF